MMSQPINRQGNRVCFTLVTLNPSFTAHLPVCPSSLRGEVHPIVWVVTVLIHDLAQAEVSDLHFPQDVAIRE